MLHALSVAGPVSSPIGELSGDRNAHYRGSQRGVVALGFSCMYVLLMMEGKSFQSVGANEIWLCVGGVHHQKTTTAMGWLPLQNERLKDLKTVILWGNS